MEVQDQKINEIIKNEMGNLVIQLCIKEALIQRLTEENKALKEQVLEKLPAKLPNGPVREPDALKKA